MFSATCLCFFSLFFFFNDTATTEIYTLSLHDALPIAIGVSVLRYRLLEIDVVVNRALLFGDRKSTRLNSSHRSISYAVFCLKKKKKKPVSNMQIKHKTKHTRTR